MIEIVRQLLSAKSHVEKNPGCSVKLSLDLNDPDTKKLAAFAKKLMLPTTKIHASGMVTETGMVIPERADQFILELRKIVGDEIMNELENDLVMQIRQRNAPGDLAAATIERFSDEAAWHFKQGK